MSSTRSERSLLLRHLSEKRHHVLAQVDGLTDAQLRNPVLPSGWSPLGLVRHLTLSDERYWFHVVMGGAPLDNGSDEADGGWKVDLDADASDIIGAYRDAILRSDEIITGLEVDSPPAFRDHWWAQANLDFPDLRSVMLHMIVETATHAGHLDAARELIDGHQHLVL
jgi:Protein of unknown function (DUF664)